MDKIMLLNCRISDGKIYDFIFKNRKVIRRSKSTHKYNCMTYNFLTSHDMEHTLAG